MGRFFWIAVVALAYQEAEAQKHEPDLSSREQANRARDLREPGLDKVDNAVAGRGLRAGRIIANTDVANLAADSPENVGCFSDMLGDRVLLDLLRRDDMTPDVCRTHCAEHLYYGTQHGNECWCGSSDSVGEYDRHGKGSCDMACAGDASITCGGHFSFDLFKMSTEVGLARSMQSEECSGSPVEPYGKCGGDGHTGSTCCREGYSCTSMGTGGCYSQCRPIPGGCAGKNKRCGGRDYEGTTCCWPGYSCEYEDQWWSSCVPIEDFVDKIHDGIDVVV